MMAIYIRVTEIGRGAERCRRRVGAVGPHGLATREFRIQAFGLKKTIGHRHYV